MLSRYLTDLARQAPRMTLVEAASIAESTIHLVQDVRDPAMKRAASPATASQLLRWHQSVVTSMHSFKTPPSMWISSAGSSPSQGRPSIASANRSAGFRLTSGAGGSRAASRSSSRPLRTLREYPRSRSGGDSPTRQRSAVPSAPCMGSHRAKHALRATSASPI